MLDWLRVEFAVEKPSQKLQDVAALDADGLVDEVKKARGKKKPLTVADLKRLREEHGRSIVPLQTLAAEARTLERQVSELVNAAYGLTPEEVALMWKTAPPRMPGVPSVAQNSRAFFRTTHSAPTHCPERPMIPDLTPQVGYPYSLLPDGVHSCDEEALRLHFVDRFPDSRTRRADLRRLPPAPAGCGRPRDRGYAVGRWFLRRRGSWTPATWTWCRSATTPS